MLRSVLRTWLPSRRPTPRRPAAPRLEALEDRTVPSTFLVTNLLDDGSAGSLRWAVAQANGHNNALNPNGVADEIDFSLPQTLTSSTTKKSSSTSQPPTITLTGGELDITDSLIINGPGQSALTISGNNASRVFNVASGIVVGMANLTIANGESSFYFDGGGIYNAGDLTLGRVTVSGNHAADGGGIYNSGSLSLEQVTLSNNRASGSDFDIDGQGGGVYNSGTLAVLSGTLSGNVGNYGGALNNAGTMTMTGCTLSGNTADDYGGAVQNSGSATISGSTFSGNVGNSWGGDISNAGTLTLSNSTLTGGTAQESGGSIFNNSGATATLSSVTVAGASASSAAGLSNAGVLSLTGCTIQTNKAGSNGGGIGNYGGTLTITSSAIQNNQAAAFNGGGIYNTESGVITVSQSLIAGNLVGGRGGGIHNDMGAHITLTSTTVANNQANDSGGGISAEDNGQGAVSVITLINATVAGNVANADGKGGGNGGGIYNETDGSVVSLRNTLVANNTTNRVGPDVANVITSLGYNLVGSTAGGSGFAAGDLLNVAPKLGPLQNNGGPTATMALLPGSPAVDAGDPDPTGLPPSDQHGLPRVVCGRVDIGAFEATNTATHLALTAPASVTAGVSFSLTVTALDAYGRVATGYAGTVRFGSSDATAILPANYTFTATGGVAVVSVILRKRGKQTVTVTDTLDASITGSVTVTVG
jgi:predicted outer membrane repeat protein